MLSNLEDKSDSGEVLIQRQARGADICGSIAVNRDEIVQFVKQGNDICIIYYSHQTKLPEDPDLEEHNSKHE